MKNPMHHASCASRPCSDRVFATLSVNDGSNGSRNLNHPPQLPSIGRERHSTRSAYGVRSWRHIRRSDEFAIVFAPQLLRRRWQESAYFSNHFSPYLRKRLADEKSYRRVSPRAR